ncbi:hypothetical protein ACCJ75_004574 [Escherichia coli]
MKIVLIDDNKYYRYGIECLLINIFSRLSDYRVKIYYEWPEVDKNTDIVFLSLRSSVLQDFYRENISKISNEILVLFITDDFLPNRIKTTNELNRLTLWRGESVLYVEKYMKNILINKEYLVGKQMISNNDEISEKLTPIEFRFVILLSSGYGLKEVGGIIGIKKNALYGYKYSIMKKKKLKNKYEFNKFLVDFRRFGIPL